MKHNLLALISDRQKVEGRLLTIYDISKATGIHRNTVRFWLQNPKVERIDADTVMRFCKYFGVTLDGLLEIVPDEEQQI